MSSTNLLKNKYLGTCTKASGYPMWFSKCLIKALKKTRIRVKKYFNPIDETDLDVRDSWKNVIDLLLNFTWTLLYKNRICYNLQPSVLLDLYNNKYTKKKESKFSDVMSLGLEKAPVMLMHVCFFNKSSFWFIKTIPTLICLNVALTLLWTVQLLNWNSLNVSKCTEPDNLLLIFLRNYAVGW